MRIGISILMLFSIKKNDYDYNVLMLFYIYVNTKVYI